MMQTDKPLVSVIIPARNEAQYIESCLRCILDGTYAASKMEILVVDGCSEDGTREIVSRIGGEFPNIHLLDNPHKLVSHAMNIGIRAARAELVVRMDAHASYDRNYLQQLVTWMKRLEADNVGGIVVTRPASDSAQAKAVAAILSHPFGVGNSLFRLQGLDRPIEVDTVPFGCYRREIFDRIGLYDEIFVRNQDDELNARLKRSGGKIFLIPEIRIDYVARESLRKLLRMLYQYGYFKPLIAIKHGRPATLRQLAPPAFIAALIGLGAISFASTFALGALLVIIAIYAAVNIAASIQIARGRGWRLFPYTSAGFLWAHLSYGWGYLRGLWDFGVCRKHENGMQREVPLSR